MLSRYGSTFEVEKASCFDKKKTSAGSVEKVDKQKCKTKWDRNFYSLKNFGNISEESSNSKNVLMSL